MLLQELLDHDKKDRMLAVVYGGRFQPFHKGHMAVYEQLCTWFGKETVWIATSNKVNTNGANGDISPLNFEERKEVMVRMFDLDPNRIVQCKNPAFYPVEILDKYKGDTVCIMAVGAKDLSRYSESKFFDKYPMHKGSPVEIKQVIGDLADVTTKPKMYYLPVGIKAGNISGTKARAILKKLSNDTSLAERKKAFKDIFGTGYDEIVYELLISKIAQVE
jgi:cytidyltransferase-like protein